MEVSVTEKFQSNMSPIAQFNFLTGWRAGQTVPVTKETFFIGRSRNNNLIMEDRSVSRKHAVLNFLEGQFVLSDLNSFKGIMVNGKKVNEAIIKNGDRIRIGDIVLEFHTGRGMRGGGRRLVIIMMLLVAVGVGASSYFYFQKSKGPKDELLREIAHNYSRGVKAFNIDKDVDTARRYWDKVLELDPEMKSSEARKAEALLNNFFEDFGGSEDR